MFALFESQERKLERVCRLTGNDIILAQLAKDPKLDLTRYYFDDGWTPQHLCAINGFAPCLKILLASGTQMNERLASDGSTPLMLAAYAGHTAAVTALLDAGASLLTTCNRGFTALHYAASGGKTNICSLLVDRGADVSVVNPMGYSAMLMAACAGKTEVVAFFLSNTTSGINETEAKGNTCLHMACAGGYVTLVDFLMQAGADNLASNRRGKTPVELCKTKNRKDVRIIINSSLAQREFACNNPEQDEQLQPEQVALTIQHQPYLYPTGYEMAETTGKGAGIAVAAAAGLALLPLIGGYKVISDTVAAANKSTHPGPPDPYDDSANGSADSAESSSSGGFDLDGFDSSSDSELPAPNRSHRDRPRSNKLARLKQQITDIYTQCAPHKLADLPTILTEWAGNEEALLGSVRKTYPQYLPPAAADLGSALPIDDLSSLGRTARVAMIHRAVTALYQQVSPAMNNDLPQLFREWAGAEEDMLASVLVQHAATAKKNPAVEVIQELSTALASLRAAPNDAARDAAVEAAAAKVDDLALSAKRTKTVRSQARELQEASLLLAQESRAKEREASAARAKGMPDPNVSSMPAYLATAAASKARGPKKLTPKQLQEQSEARDSGSDLD